MATILICEDDPPIAELLADICTDAGHSPVVTRTGTECIQRALDLKPPLIFIDVSLLGGITGYRVCKQLRENKSTGSAYIAIATARTGDEVEKLAKAAGANEVINKPFSPKAIAEIVKRVCDDNTGNVV